MLRDMQCHVVQTGVSISDVHGHGKSSCRELFGLVLAAALMLPSLGLSQVTVSTLSSADVAGRLQGKSGSNRAAEIAAIAPLLKAGLAAQEAADILGSATDLSEYYRFSAIAALARAKKLGTPGADSALMLKATTGNNRALAISEIAPYLKTGLTAQETANILGSATDLSEYYRFSAIAALARAKKIRAGLPEAELAPILAGVTGSNRTLALSELAALGPPGTAAGAGVAAAPQPPPTTTSGNGSTSSGPIPAPTEMPVGKNSPTTPITVQCDAPRAAIDKPSPTCGERWQTAIFRANVPKVFFAANEYIDRWQAAADTGDELVEYVATLAELAVFADSVMGVKGGVAKAAQIIIKGNSSLLMLGFALPEQTLGVTIAREAVDAVRSGVEAIVEQQLRQPGGVINPWTVAPKVVTLANSLLSYANTVRYSRLRNTYTLALQYLRLLYRMGGDQTAFAQSLGLAANASVQDCLSAVNRRSFGFPTQLTDAGAFNATLAEKVVNHWVTAISEYAALKEQ